MSVPSAASASAKRVMILGASRYYSRSIESARRAGYWVLAIDRTADAPGFAAANAFAVVDIIDRQGVLEAARAHRIDAVVPVNDYGVPTAAFVAEHLGLPGISQHAAHLATDKSAMRNAWIAAGLPCPKVQLARTRAEFEHAISKVGLPCIFKPAHGIGGASRGVVVVQSMSELTNAMAFAQSFYENQETLVESFVQAEVEHSVELLVVNGVPHVIAVADKVKSPLPYRVDRTVLYPSALNPTQLGRVEETARQSVRALGISTGAAHVELATTKDGCVLFELGARCGGGGTPEPIVPWVTGIDYFAELVRILAGDAPTELAPSFQRGAAYHFLMPDPGLVACVTGMESVREMPDVLDAEVFCTAGSRIAPVRVGTERAGFIIAGAATRQEAYDSALRAEQLLEITYCEESFAAGVAL